MEGSYVCSHHFFLLASNSFIHATNCSSVQNLDLFPAPSTVDDDDDDDEEEEDDDE
jgi:hypothetical protein